MITRREQNRTIQRARILAAARERFSADGFEAVTVADVAAAAGVARATVFNHFSSKHGLVEALVHDVQTIYHSMLGVALDDRTTPTPVLLVALFEQIGVGIEADRRFFRGVFQVVARVQVGLDEEALASTDAETAHRRLTELIERGQARGDLNTEHEAASVVLAITSLINGTITSWLYDPAPESLTTRMQAAALVLLEPVATAAVALDHPRPALVPPVLVEQENA